MVTPHIAEATQTEPRTDARVTFSDNRVFSAPVGTPLEAYTRAAFPRGNATGRVLAAVVDNRLSELSTPITRDVNAVPLTLKEPDGSRIYRRSLAFVLTTAVDMVFPGQKVAVQHAVPSGGFYCETIGRDNFSEDELQRVRHKMLDIIARDAPIVRQSLPLADAIQVFSERGDEDMVRLLENRNKNYLTIYRLFDNVDYFFGYMVPSSGYVNRFELVRTWTGFVLCFPRPESPDAVRPYQESPMLEEVFRQTDHWLRVMGIEDVGRLNQAVSEGRLREEVLIAEALHTRRLSEIAHTIAQRHLKGTRLVLIAGPSSAGKTTASKRLAVQLMSFGIQPFTLAMDDYFVDRDHTPRDEHGEFDFESLHALNLDRFNRDLLGLMQGTEVQLPRFDFKKGQSTDGPTVRLTNDHIIIVEGIHGLNPELVTLIPADKVFRMYVAALTVLNLNRHNRIPTTDVRLLRRIVRDAQHRGYTAQDTLNRWASVRRGEERNIYPYQENADVMFNSSLAYELAVLRPFADSLLRQVDIDSPRYVEARRLLAFLNWVRPASPEFVPNESLLREFIGGSILDTYLPGKRPNGTPNQANSNNHVIDMK